MFVTIYFLLGELTPFDASGASAVTIRRVLNLESRSTCSRRSCSLMLSSSVFQFRLRVPLASRSPFHYFGLAGFPANFGASIWVLQFVLLNVQVRASRLRSNFRARERVKRFCSARTCRSETRRVMRERLFSKRTQSVQVGPRLLKKPEVLTQRQTYARRANNSSPRACASTII